ncbi:methionyl-tRNA formyltransferase [Actinomadura alba]|uniref:Methionyl-tRNA formyltransferase n=2 Tax=Actinomadura alba TaxID=406431 RepID=A0ABR7LPB6_9ACTN|nr:methionyl-tRNA formyltransferase [Actinomadura alba]
MRLALVSFGVNEFSVLHEICVEAGHFPVAYAYSRSMRPRMPTDAHAVATIGQILKEMPPAMDFLLPGSAEGLGQALAGYSLDLIVVYGFSWRLPRSVLQISRFGAINVHSSLLPKYRGPAPVLWAIRNGDPHIGITIHRMDENFDTGPILAQQGGITLEDEVTPERLWPHIRPVIRDLLPVALERVSRHEAGEEQDDADVSYAGLMEPEFSLIDWSRTAREIHNQVRTFRFMGQGQGPIARVGERWLKVLRTQLREAPGVRVECADGPIWIVASESTEPPASETRGLR